MEDKMTTSFDIREQKKKLLPRIFSKVTKILKI